MTDRRLKAISWPALLLALLAVLACTSSPPPVTRSTHIPADAEGYLIDPLAGFPLAADPVLEEQARAAFRTIRTGGELDAVGPAMDEILAADPGFHPARVVQAQLAFLDEDYGAVRELLAPVVDELPNYLACQLLFGRAAELEEDLVVAFHAYRRLVGSSSFALERVRELQPHAVEVALEAFHETLDRGHVEAAEEMLAELSTWAVPTPGVQLSGEEVPEVDLRILEAQHRLAYEKGDVEAELALVREIVARDPYNDVWEERLGELELEVGDVRAALERFERLAEARVDDFVLAEKVARAKFLWRLELLPEHVRKLRAQVELNRAEFASLLYWLVPEVRYAPVDDPPIATDILDHPRHEEILAVMNLDLIAVNEDLHHFSPAEPMTRELALRALLGLLGLPGQAFTCLPEGDARSVLLGIRSVICRKASDCGLIPSPADCLAGARISGDEAMELFRRTLDLLGSGATAPPTSPIS